MICLQLAADTILDSQYRIVDLVGEGGMGQVYSAVEVELGRLIALKVIPYYVFSDPDSKARFIREGQLLSQLEHPNVVRFYKFGEAQSVTYIAMEFVKGSPWSKLLQKEQERTDIEIKETFRLLKLVAAAIDYMHSSGVVHRDLKPGNVLITESGEPKIIDLGLARADTSERLTNTGMLLGTAAYMSPEQCLGQHAKKESDLYSFGCIAYEALTGETPCGTGEPIAVFHKHVNVPPKTVRPHFRDETVVASIDSVFAKALSKSPAHRYTSATEFVEKLERAFYFGESETEFGFRQVEMKPRRLNRVVVAGAIIFALSVSLALLHSQIVPAVWIGTSYLFGEDNSQKLFSNTLSTLNRFGGAKVSAALADDLVRSSAVSLRSRMDLLLTLASNESIVRPARIDFLTRAVEMLLKHRPANLIAVLEQIRLLKLPLAPAIVVQLNDFGRDPDERIAAKEAALASSSDYWSDVRGQIQRSLLQLYRSLAWSYASKPQLKEARIAAALRLIDENSDSSLQGRLAALYERALLFSAYDEHQRMAQSFKEADWLLGRLLKTSDRDPVLADSLMNCLQSSDQVMDGNRFYPLVEKAITYVDNKELLATPEGASLATLLLSKLVEHGQPERALHLAKQFYRSNRDAEYLKFAVASLSLMNGTGDGRRLLADLSEFPDLRISTTWREFLKRALMKQRTNDLADYLFVLSKTPVCVNSAGNDLFLQSLLFEDFARRKNARAQLIATTIVDSLKSESFTMLKTSERLDLLATLIVYHDHLTPQQKLEVAKLGECYAKELRTTPTPLIQGSLFRYYTTVPWIWRSLGDSKKEEQALLNALSVSDSSSPDATKDVFIRCWLVFNAVTSGDAKKARAHADVLRSLLVKTSFVPEKTKILADEVLLFVDALDGDAAKVAKFTAFHEAHKARLPANHDWPGVLDGYLKTQSALQKH